MSGKGFWRERNVQKKKTMKETHSRERPRPNEYIGRVRDIDLYDFTYT